MKKIFLQRLAAMIVLLFASYVSVWAQEICFSQFLKSEKSTFNNFERKALVETASFEVVDIALIGDEFFFSFKEKPELEFFVSAKDCREAKWIDVGDEVIVSFYAQEKNNSLQIKSINRSFKEKDVQANVSFEDYLQTERNLRYIFRRYYLECFNDVERDLVKKVEGGVFYQLGKFKQKLENESH